MRLDENTLIGDILDAHSGSEDVFLTFGMSCMGCPSSRGETILEACEIHGVEPGELLSSLRDSFSK